MNDDLPPRRRGRPKGLPRPAGSGRKKGTPNRVTKEVREAAQKFGKQGISALVRLLNCGDPKIEFAAARELLDRAYGRPSEASEKATD